MAERFKAADCKSVELSHRRFKSCFLYEIMSEYNAAVACLLWEQEAMCSNHIIPKLNETQFKKNFKFADLNWKNNKLLTLQSVTFKLFNCLTE